MVDQIHDAIFHATHAEMVNDMHNQWEAISVHVFRALQLH